MGDGFLDEPGPVVRAQRDPPLELKRVSLRWGAVGQNRNRKLAFQHIIMGLQPPNTRWRSQHHPLEVVETFLVGQQFGHQPGKRTTRTGISQRKRHQPPPIGHPGLPRPALEDILQSLPWGFHRAAAHDVHPVRHTPDMHHPRQHERAQFARQLHRHRCECALGQATQNGIPRLRHILLSASNRAPPQINFVRQVHHAGLRRGWRRLVTHLLDHRGHIKRGRHPQAGLLLAPVCLQPLIECIQGMLGFQLGDQIPAVTR
ncbi:hypothetical protein MYSI104531_27315 [Mycobacterium simiae]